MRICCFEENSLKIVNRAIRHQNITATTTTTNTTLHIHRIWPTSRQNGIVSVLNSYDVCEFVCVSDICVMSGKAIVAEPIRRN